MTAWLADLDEADRGFLTWLAAMAGRSLEAVLEIVEVEAEGERIVSLDLSELAPHLAGRRLRPPFAGLDGLVRLDCSHLGLAKLELRPMRTLRHLRCAGNALREIDLSGCPDLETLDCSANAMMTLDLSGLGALRELDCRDNALAMVVIDSPNPLQRLDCSHNQLMVLDLGDAADLVELRCARNALVRLAGRCPGLTALWAGHNELTRLELGRLTNLQTLAVPHNRLADVDVAPSLTALDVAHNYLAALDLSGATVLRDLAADHNQIVAIAWPRRSALVTVRVDDNRLSSLAPPAGPTRVITCDRNGLARVETAALPELTKLSCAHNALTWLEVADNPRLVDIDVRDNPLARLDLTNQAHLCVLMVDAPPDGPHVTLREGSLVDGATPGADLTQADARALHRAALAAWNGGSFARLAAIVSHEHCDWGTALLVYWTLRPRRVRRAVSREELEAFEVPLWELVRAIETRATTTGFATRQIPFDPRDDRTTRSVEGVDWTTGDGPVPDVLLEAVLPQ